MTLGINKELDWETLLEQLECAEESIRRMAVDHLMEFPYEDALPLLITRMGDSSWRLRKRSVELLLGLPDRKQVIDALTPVIIDRDNPGRRNAAVDALAQCGEEVIPNLLVTLHHPDADVRKFSIDILARIGSEETIEYLVEFLSDDDENVQAAAADALGMIGDKKAVELLVGVIRNPGANRFVRFSALRALERIDVMLPPEQLGDVFEDALLRPAAFQVLNCLNDDRTIALLLSSLVSESRSSREAAMNALLRLLRKSDAGGMRKLRREIRTAIQGAPDVVNDALKRLRSSEFRTRMTLVPFLGLLGAPEAVLPILWVAEDPTMREIVVKALISMGEIAERVMVEKWGQLSNESRLLTCEVFGVTRSERGFAHLTQLAEESEIDLRAAALRAIGRYGGPRALAVIQTRLDALLTESEYQREIELDALADAARSFASASKQSKAILDDLIRGIYTQSKDAPSDVRIAIASILENLARLSEEDLVSHMLKDPCPEVRREAVHTFARLGVGMEKIRLVLGDEAPMVRAAAADALASLGASAALEDLQHLARDEDPTVRACSIRALGELVRAQPSSPEDRAEIFSILEVSLNDDGFVVMAVVEALRGLGGADVVRLARQVLDLQDADLVQEAIGCIAEHGSLEDVEGLLPYISNEQWSIRAAAIQAIGGRRFFGARPVLGALIERENDPYVLEVARRTLALLEMDGDAIS